MISISNPGSIIYPQKFSAGDVAISKKLIHFCDGTIHRVGDEIKITEKTTSYYNVCHEDYDKKHD